MRGQGQYVLVCAENKDDGGPKTPYTQSLGLPQTHQGGFIFTIVGDNTRQFVIKGEIKAEFCPVVPTVIAKNHTAQLDGPQTLLQSEVWICQA